MANNHSKMKANFEQLLQDSNLVGDFIQHEVAVLDPEQLYWKPSETTWSLIEIVEHLNLIYDKYLVNMGGAIDQSAPLGEQQDQKKKTTLLGSLSVHAMKPKKEKVRYKMKTFDFFDPNNDHKNAESILSQFAENKNRFTPDCAIE